MYPAFISNLCTGRLAVVLALFVLVVSGCGDDDDDTVVELSDQAGSDDALAGALLTADQAPDGWSQGAASSDANSFLCLPATVDTVVESRSVAQFRPAQSDEDANLSHNVALYSRGVDQAIELASLAFITCTSFSFRDFPVEMLEFPELGDESVAMQINAFSGGPDEINLYAVYVRRSNIISLLFGHGLSRQDFEEAARAADERVEDFVNGEAGELSTSDADSSNLACSVNAFELKVSVDPDDLPERGDGDGAVIAEAAWDSCRFVVRASLVEQPPDDFGDERCNYTFAVRYDEAGFTGESNAGCEFIAIETEMGEGPPPDD